MKIIDGLDPWDIKLKSGSALTVWAGGYSEAAGIYIFSVYVEIEENEPGMVGVEIANMTPANPRRISIVTARVPVDDVDEIRSRDL